MATLEILKNKIYEVKIFSKFRGYSFTGIVYYTFDEIHELKRKSICTNPYNGDYFFEDSNCIYKFNY